MVCIFVISRLNGTKELIISIIPSYPLTNERDRERDKDRERDGERDRETERETQRERHRERDTERQRGRETENTNLSQEKTISRVGGTLTCCRMHMLMDD